MVGARFLFPWTSHVHSGTSRYYLTGGVAVALAAGSAAGRRLRQARCAAELVAVFHEAGVPKDLGGARPARGRDVACHR